MQTLIQKQQPNYLTAKGKNGIITRIRIKLHLNKHIQRTEVTGRKIDDIALAYMNANDFINIQPVGTREKFKPILKRLKSQAKVQIIRDGILNDAHIDIFGFRLSDLSKKIQIRQLILGFINEALKSDPFFFQALERHAHNGKAVDYRFANDLIKKFNRLINKWRENVENESQYEKLRRQNEITELSDLINQELNDRNKEKAVRSNLCYFLLYDRTTEEATLDDDSATSIRDDQVDSRANYTKLIGKIKNLSLNNMEELIQIYCKANNDFYKNEIAAMRSKKKNETNRKNYSPVKDFTPIEKWEFIRLYKEDGLKNKEIAKATGFPLRTVERYGNMVEPPKIR